MKRLKNIRIPVLTNLLKYSPILAFFSLYSRDIYFFIEKLITYACAMSISHGVTRILCLSYNEFLRKSIVFKAEAQLEKIQIIT